MLILAAGLFCGFNARALEQTREVSVVGTRLSTIFNGQENRSNPRILIWKTAPKILADHPFLGIGQGNFASVSPHYGLYDVGSLPYNHAHDLFLNIAVETGVFGLAALVWLLVAVGRLISFDAAGARPADLPARRGPGRRPGGAVRLQPPRLPPANERDHGGDHG